MKSLKSILTTLGLTEKEATIYLAALQFNQLSASSLARITGLPRPTIYDITQRLVKKGYIKSSRKNSKTIFTAIDPQSVFVVLNEKRNLLDEQITSFKDAIPEFKSLKEFSGIVPKIEYYEGKEGLGIAFNNIADATYSYSIFSIDAILKHIYFDIEHLFETIAHQEVKGAKRIILYSEAAKKYLAMQSNENILRKMLPKGYEMEAEISLYDGVLLQMSFGEQPTILEMKHPVYYKAHKMLFEFMWDSLPEYKEI